MKKKSLMLYLFTNLNLDLPLNKVLIVWKKKLKTFKYISNRFSLAKFKFIIKILMAVTTKVNF